MVGARDIELDSDIHNRKQLEDMSIFNETFNIGNTLENSNEVPTNLFNQIR